MKNFFRTSMARNASATMRFRPAIFVFALALLTTGGGGVTILNAQTPLARFVAPTNTTGISTTPTFEIITAYPIDTSSVHWTYLSGDSVTYHTISVCVIPYEVYSTETDTFWQMYAAEGTGTFVNDTTISFTSNPLQNQHEFAAVLMGVRVINGADTITIPDTVAQMTFTTANLPPDLVSSSVFDSSEVVRTHDTITAIFSEKLDSTNSPAGPLVSLEVPKITFDTTDDTVITSDSTIAATAWLDAADSTKLHILPAQPFVPGENYEVKVALSGLTGDTTQDGEWGFVCKKSFLLNIVAAPTGGLTCLDTVHFDPTINENYRAINDSQVVFDTSYIGRVVNAGDTVRYTAPSQVGGAVFEHWTGSGNPAIDTSTNPVLTISQTADQLNDMNIVALYGPVAVDTVCVATSGTNNPAVNQDFVLVTSDSLDCPLTTLNDTCASTQSVSYPLERGKVIRLYAYSLYDSAMFSHWSSSDSAINGLTSPEISFVTNGNTCATAVFTTPPPGQYFLFASVSVDGVGPADPSIAQIIAPTPTPPTTSWAMSTAMACGTAQAATVKILNPNYGLESYTVDEGNSTCGNVIMDSHDFTKDAPGFQPKDLYVASGAPYPCAGDGTFTPPDATQDDFPPTFVEFVVKPIIRKLILVLRTNNNTSTEGTFLTFTDPTKTGSGMWCWVKTKPISWKRLGHWWFGWWWAKQAWCGYSQPTYEIYELDYTSGTNVEIEAGTGSTQNPTSDNFVQWEAGCTNTVWPTPQTQSDFTISMTKDQAATATYHVPFKIMSVSYEQQPNYGSPATQWVTKSVNNWGTVQGGVTGWNSPWTQTNYTTIAFNFNEQVATGGGGEVPLAYIEDGAEFGKDNMDKCNALKPKVGATLDPPNFNGEIYGSSLYFSIDGHRNNEEYRLWKGQGFHFVLPAWITSVTGEPLSNPQTLNMSSINPEVTWYYHKTRIYDAHDPCFICGNDNTEWVEVAGGCEPGATLTWLNTNWFFTCMETNVEDNNGNGKDYMPDPYIQNQACTDGCTGGTDILITSNGANDPEHLSFNAGALGIIHDMGDDPTAPCFTWPCARHDEETDHNNMPAHMGQNMGITNIGDQIYDVHLELNGHEYCTGDPGKAWLSAEWNLGPPLGKTPRWWGAAGLTNGIWTMSGNPSGNTIDMKIVLQ